MIDPRSDILMRTQRGVFAERASGNHLRIRSTALAGLALCGLCFWISLSLTPSPKGFGTHRQLGYPACLMPLLTGYPCPTCGMTTAFAHAARGQLASAFHAQPAGLCAFLGLVAAGSCCVRALITGRCDFLRVIGKPGRIAVVVLCMLIFGWAYKIITFSP